MEAPSRNIAIACTCGNVQRSSHKASDTWQVPRQSRRHSPSLWHCAPIEESITSPALIQTDIYAELLMSLVSASVVTERILGVDIYGNALTYRHSHCASKVCRDFSWEASSERHPTASTKPQSR